MSRLRDEIKKRHDFDSLEQEAMLNLQRSADCLMRDVETVLKPAGLSATAYNVLRILRGAGEALACGEIAMRMITREPDMTRLLDRLESRGLLTRMRDKRDRRVVLSTITPAGAALLGDLDEPLRLLHRRQLAHLGDHKLRLLIDLLEEARTRKSNDQHHQV
jgi:DNA-binding MarR family transcriptional regulator